ncbi:hypothetical protein GGR50DRAFT_677747 [Xylaria sp. CBS 124048]|nr:hypothetical protein GGR50DRAFT_677747 [Xylaria sp. CBS 124048]
MPFTTITVFPSSSTVTVADITTLSVIATSTSSIQKPIFSSIDTLGNSTVISTLSATLPALNGTRSETTSTSVHFLISTIDIASVTGASATPSSSLTSLMNTKPHHHKTSPAKPFSTITSILETVPIDEQTSTIIVGAVTFTTLQLFSTITETISPLPLSSPSSSSTADAGHLVADSQ